MTVNFYKSLDREFELFGIKGKWVKVVLYGAGLGLALAMIVGSVAGSIVGIITLIIVVALVLFGSMTISVKLPSRQIDKALISSKCESWVVRRETLSIILYGPANVKKKN